MMFKCPAGNCNIKIGSFSFSRHLREEHKWSNDDLFDCLFTHILAAERAKEETVKSDNASALPEA